MGTVIQIPKLAKPWLFLIAIALILGIFFRFTNLESKVYWVDEVATSMRISGYSEPEVTEALVARGLVDIQELQRYQRLSPEKDFGDALSALKKSPEHAPLYFILARGWVQLFGNSVAAIRSLSVLLSLLALPCIYWLTWELFNCSLTGEIALIFLSISPFYVAYAQEARPYSLWLLTILLSSLTLLRAIRLNNLLSWGAWALGAIAGCYTSVLSVLLAIAQGLYAVKIAKISSPQVLRNYLITASIVLVAFLPWLSVIVDNFQNLEENTSWMREAMPLPIIAAILMYSIKIIVANVPVSLTHLPTMVLGITLTLSLSILAVFSLGFTVLKAELKQGFFILTLVLAIPLTLLSIDLILRGQCSATPRYLIPSQIGIILAIAYCLTRQLSAPQIRKQKLGKIILAILMTVAILSCTVNLERSPIYLKTRNRYNGAISAIVNQAKSPILLAEKTETSDLISLSYSLEPKVKVQLLGESQGAGPLENVSAKCYDLFLFNPSAEWRDIIASESDVKIVQVYQPERLIASEISLSLWTVSNMKSTKECYKSSIPLPPISPQWED